MISTQTQKILFLQTQPLCCVVIENTNIHLVIISCVTVNYFPGCTPMFKTLFVSKFNHNFMSMFLLPSNQHIRGNLDLPGFNIFYCVTDNSTWVFFLQYEKAIPCLSECRKISQPAFSCSKLTTEALEQGVKYVPS